MVKWGFALTSVSNMRAAAVIFPLTDHILAYALPKWWYLLQVRLRAGSCELTQRQLGSKLASVSCLSCPLGITSRSVSRFIKFSFEHYKCLTPLKWRWHLSGTTTSGWILCSPTSRRTEMSTRRTGTVRWTSGRPWSWRAAGTAAPCVSACRSWTRPSGGGRKARWAWLLSSRPWPGNSVVSPLACWLCPGQSAHSACMSTSVRCGKIQRESEFAANVDCGWLSWGVGLLLVKPLKWTFSTLLGSSRVPLEESFVVIELVKVCQCVIMWSRWSQHGVFSYT